MPKSGDSHRLEHAIRAGLLGGVVLAGLAMAAGLGLVFMNGEHGNGKETAGTVRGLFGRALNGDGLGLLELGILVLIFTPMLRVAMLAIGWSISRQFRFAASALAVLAMLLTSLWLGLG